jgi:hypothetical protein
VRPYLWAVLDKVHFANLWVKFIICFLHANKEWELTTRIDVTHEFIKELIKPRSRDSRKGDNGIVLVVGGSKLYHGAPVLSSLAALRSGFYCYPTFKCNCSQMLFSRSNRTTHARR